MITTQDLMNINLDGYQKEHSYGFVKEDSCKLTGENACLYKYKQTTILCFIGTHNTMDYWNDLEMYLGKVPGQLKQAERLFMSLKQAYHDIVLTGHSLGGTIAQNLGAKYGNKTVCFSPYGFNAFHITSSCNNVSNYGMESDRVFMGEIDCQLGKTYIIENPKNKYHFVKNGVINYALLVQKELRNDIRFKGHKLEEYNSLSKAVLLNRDSYNQALIHSYCRKPEMSNIL